MLYSRDFLDSITITREGHPSRAARSPSLAVSAAAAFSLRWPASLTAVALIPAQWTDWDEGHCDSLRACREANAGSRALGSLGDLLQLRHLVDALRGRSTGSPPLQKGSVVQLNLAFFDPPDAPGGALSESLWEQLDESARRTALEILARLIARMLVAAANEASHE